MHIPVPDNSLPPTTTARAARLRCPRQGVQTFTAIDTPTEGDASSTDVTDNDSPDSLNLRNRFVQAISSATGFDAKENKDTNGNHDGGTTGSGGASAHGSGSSPHGSGSGHGGILGQGSGHDSSGSPHGTGSGHSIMGTYGGMLSLALSGGNGGGSGSGHDGGGGGSGGGVFGGGKDWGAPPPPANQRRLSTGSGGGSRHSAVGMGSLHGSAIPEDGEMLDWGSDHHRAAASSSAAGTDLLTEVGKHMSRAFSGAFLSEHGSTASGATAAPGDHRGDDTRGAESGAEGESDGGFLEHVDRVISSLTIGGNSGHGAGWGSSTGGGSGHGSVLGSNHGGGVVRGGSGGTSSNSQRPGTVSPWSQSQARQQQEGDVRRGTDSSHNKMQYSKDGSEDDGMVEGFKRGVERAMSVVGVAPSPSAASGCNENNSLHSMGNSMHDFISASSRHSAILAARKAPGYEAAMANWPAGKVPGEPAWEVWSPKKKVAAHFITAVGLALIVATW